MGNAIRLLQFNYPSITVCISYIAKHSLAWGCPNAIWVAGTLPSNWKLPETLTSINLGSNLISGTIPPQPLGNADQVYLDNNKLAGVTRFVIRNSGSDKTRLEQ